MATPLAFVLPVTFPQAIRAAASRVSVLPSIYYGELQAAARSRAFTISGLAGLTQIRQALDDLNAGLHDGMTFGEWKNRALEQEWNLPDHRLDTIMRVHTQTAYNAGHWEQFEANAARRGYLMYSAINDSRTRPAHRAMDGIIKPVGDSFWDSHSPPCGYNCRCSLVSLTDTQVQDRGGETQQLPPDANADPGWGSKPSHVGIDVNDLVARQALDLPAPLQKDVLDWQAAIRDERIVQRVQDFFGTDYAQLAQDVQTWLIDNDGLLIEHEAVSIHGYTGDYYRNINRFLRGEGGDDLSTMAPVVSAVAGLSKLPEYEGTVFRGITLEGLPNAVKFLEAHQAGEIVEYSAFTSAGYKEPFAGNVQYVIHSRYGRVVEALSPHPSEMEVLFAPRTRFRIVSIDATNLPVRIEMEELADQTVEVPLSHRFTHEAQHRAQQRMDDEAKPIDPATLDRFKAAHDGLDPIEYALLRFPSARLEVEAVFPHLVKDKTGT
jgi:SPP1 gp7 family putative phage head morphogenesis protein